MACYHSEHLSQLDSNERNSTMLGVLVDVSGSMRNAYALDSSHDASVERVHAIITTILNIVKSEATRHNRLDEMFATAFGIDIGDRTDTCDLIALLEHIAGPVELRHIDGHDGLVSLAKKREAGYAEDYIRKHLSYHQARYLYRILHSNERLIQQMVDKLPSELTQKRFSATTGALSSILSTDVGSRIEGSTVRNLKAYQFGEELIRDDFLRVIRSNQQPTPKPVQHISELLDDLNILSEGSSLATTDHQVRWPVSDVHLSRHSQRVAGVSSRRLHTRIRELIEPIKPYIYGGTPMRKAMRDALTVFRQTPAKSKKVLFILSDGESADGDPLQIAQELERSGVTIATCYLTEKHIGNPKGLLDQAPGDWSKKDGRLTLFRMSSTMRNIDPPVSYLVDAGWTLPASGECRLFVQANSLDVVDELCKTVVSQLTNPCDGLVDVLEKVPLATYINQSNADFQPKEQDDKTCYANAVAAVFHLAMHRIVGREGGYPDFFKIRKRLIQEYGKDGANTRKVLEKVCPEYRLHFREVDEIHARQALNHRRPVVARFSLYDEQWTRFSKFYRTTPKGILERSDVGGGSTKPGGHAVVLIRCNPQCLVFMNSWGQSWADGGFFQVKDAQVLNDVKFYDVYWTLNDLSEGEKEAYRRKGAKRAKELAERFPSINNLLFECPTCRRTSRVGDFNGDLLEATCLKCRCKFKPTNEDLVKSLYLRNM